MRKWHMLLLLVAAVLLGSCQGPPGPAGPRGASGDKGAQGEPGATPREEQIEAIVARVVARQLKELEPVDAPILTAAEAENLVLNHIMPCYLTHRAESARISSKYTGEREWLVRISVDRAEFADGSIAPMSFGMWRLLERTGDILPYDAGAKGTEDLLKYGCPRR